MQAKFLKMNDIKIYVVSQAKTLMNPKKNLKQRMVEIPMLLSRVKDYEKSFQNFAELRRYIEQQKAIILYYEKAVQPVEAEPNQIILTNTIDGNSLGYDPRMVPDRLWIYTALVGSYLV